MPKPTLHEIVKINAQYILLKCVDVYIMYWIVWMLFYFVQFFMYLVRNVLILYRQHQQIHIRGLVYCEWFFGVVVYSEILWVAHSPFI